MTRDLRDLSHAALVIGVLDGEFTVEQVTTELERRSTARLSAARASRTFLSASARDEDER
jgi:hypothetical protein